jgi:hypothetical protein
VIIRTGDRGISRFSRMEISVHAQVLRPRGVRWRLAHNAASDVAFHPFDSVGTPVSLISRLNSPAYTYPCERFAHALTNADASLGATAGR